MLIEDLNSEKKKFTQVTSFDIRSKANKYLNFQVKLETPLLTVLFFSLIYLNFFN